MSLASARAAYLKSAAHQPVRWREWGEEAFAVARDSDRPVLLDIGAVWCHWCHVMDGESYEDASLAEFLNQHFVCIKVDRDERPDVDIRYQRAVQAMTGQGGWPLTAFLTPEGEVFYGGTYFPPEDRYGRPGFRTVLSQVLRFWREDRERALTHAASIRRAIAERGPAVQRSRGTAVEGSADVVSPASLLAAERKMLALYDPVFGGFGSAPKFPHPGAIRYLLTRWADGGSSEALLAARETLLAMARGGIHDQLAGGFHRYSVDRQWMIPHFEKMSYDNSELLRAYLDATALLGDEECRRAARGIVTWVREELALEGGGYGTSQDADIGPEDDGSYFTWTRDEMAAVLSAEELEVAATRFGLGGAGAMPHDPVRNVLFIASSPDRLTVGPSDRSLLDAAITKLRTARAARRKPFVDHTAYTSWNAMMVSAMLRAGAVLDDAWAREHAVATLGRLADRRIGGTAERSDGQTVRRSDSLPHAEGVEGLLEDQVFTAAAAIDAYEATGEQAWLDWSGAIMDVAWEAHHDPGGGLRDVARDRAGTGLLDVGQTPIEDAPVPSPNGVGAEVCARLRAHTGEQRWGDRHRAIVEAFAGIGPSLGLHGAAWCLAADWLSNPPTHLVIAGEEGDALAEAMHRAALAAAMPRRVVRRLQAAGDPQSLPAELLAMLSGTGPAGYACVGTRCLAPARTLDEWQARLAEVTRKPPG